MEFLNKELMKVGPVSVTPGLLAVVVVVALLLRKAMK